MLQARAARSRKGTQCPISTLQVPARTHRRQLGGLQRGVRMGASVSGYPQDVYKLQRDGCGHGCATVLQPSSRNHAQPSCNRDETALQPCATIERKARATKIPVSIGHRIWLRALAWAVASLQLTSSDRSNGRGHRGEVRCDFTTRMDIGARAQKLFG